MRVTYHKWELPSVWGWTLARWSVREIVHIDDEPFLLTEVALRGRYLDRKQVEDWVVEEADASTPYFWTNVDEGELGFVRDYSLRLPQMLLSESRLWQLYERLSAWLRLSLQELAAQPLDLTEELAGKGSQSLLIRLTPWPEQSATANQHWCEIAYRCAGLSGECKYVVDPSCLQVLVEGMSGYFRQRHAR